MLGSIRAIAANSFARSVGVLVSGASLAQLINLLLLPVLTQIFTPQNFDVLAVFTGVVIITHRGAALGFDYALPVAETDEDGGALLLAALAGVVTVGLLVALAAWAALPLLAPRGDASAYATFVWLVPLATMAMSATTVLDMWSTRQKRFTLISRARIGQVLAGGAIQIGLGLAGAGAEALLIGHVIGSSAGLLLTGGAFLRHDRHLLRGASARIVAAVAARYARFPKHTAAEVTLSACTVYVPVILISAVVVGPEAGFLLLALRLTQGPLLMITQAVSQVYYSRALGSRRENRLAEDTVNILRLMILFTAAPVLMLAIVAPELAHAALGAEWRPVGTYTTWMMPAMYLVFLSQSIITTMHTLGRNADILYLTAFGFVLRTGLVALAALFASGLLVQAYALGGVIFYGLSLYVFLRANGVGLLQIVPRDASFAVSLVLGAAVAVAVKLGIGSLLA